MPKVNQADEDRSMTTPLERATARFWPRPDDSPDRWPATIGKLAAIEALLVEETRIEELDPLKFLADIANRRHIIARQIAAKVDPISHNPAGQQDRYP